MFFPYCFTLQINIIKSDKTLFHYLSLLVDLFIIYWQYSIQFWIWNGCRGVLEQRRPKSCQVNYIKKRKVTLKCLFMTQQINILLNLLFYIRDLNREKGQLTSICFLTFVSSCIFLFTPSFVLFKSNIKAYHFWTAKWSQWFSNSSAMML